MHAMEAQTAMASTGSVLPIRGEALAVARDGRALLDRVTVEIGAGAGITALIGPNGAGKSLLIRTLAGLIVPDSGTVAWHDRAPGRDRMRRIGFVFQRPVMLRRSVLENILFPLTLAGIGAREARERARAELDLVGLGPIADAFARNLSGGEQQRVALARAAAGLSVVLVTQDLKQARRLATSIVMMHKGRILEHTQASTFFAKPRTAEAQRFLDGALLIDDDGGTDEGFDT